LPVTDALLLSRLADGILVVASARSTSRRDLHRTIQLLQQVQAPVLATILNRVPVDGAYAYAYVVYDYYDRDYDLEKSKKRAKVDALVARSGSSKRSPGRRNQISTEAEQLVANGSSAVVTAEGRSENESASTSQQSRGTPISDDDGSDRREREVDRTLP